jgi:hypothetical protein
MPLAGGNADGTAARLAYPGGGEEQGTLRKAAEDRPEYGTDRE